MIRKTGWFPALLILALLVAACGPTLVTPTPSGSSGEGQTPAAGQNTSTPGAVAQVSPTTTPAQGSATAEAVSPGDLPVSGDDWHVLGPADAKVTIIEYSDFQ